MYRFIKFDDEMTLVSYKWRDIWSSINTYHLGPEDRKRRERLRIVCSIMKSVKETAYDFLRADESAENCEDGAAAAAPRPRATIAQFENTKQHTFTWLNGDDREKAWTYTVHCLRTRWMELRDGGVESGITGIQCPNCKARPATHFVECVCRTCMLAGGVSPCRIRSKNKTFYCTNCTKYEAINRDYLRKVTQFVDEEIVVKTPAEKLAARLANANGRTTTTNGNRAATRTWTETTSAVLTETGNVPPLNTTATTTTAMCPKLNAALKQSAHDEWFENNSYHLAWGVFQHLQRKCFVFLI